MEVICTVFCIGAAGRGIVSAQRCRRPRTIVRRSHSPLSYKDHSLGISVCVFPRFSISLLDHVNIIIHRCGPSILRIARVPIRPLPTTAEIIRHLSVQLLSRLLRLAPPLTSSLSRSPRRPPCTVLPTLTRTPPALTRCATAADRRARAPASRRIAIDVLRHGGATTRALATGSASPAASDIVAVVVS